MRRFFVILGIGLMVFAFVILALFIILPSVVAIEDAPFLKSIMQTVACQPNETLSASYSTYSTPGRTTRSTDMSCVDNEGHERDVSGQLIGIGGVGYLVPFLVGLFMTLLAGRTSMKSRTTAFSISNRNSGVTYYPDQNFRVEAVPAHVPLAQQLQELKDAYSAGLITEAEYSAKRKALLNE